MYILLFCKMKYILIKTIIKEAALVAENRLRDLIVQNFKKYFAKRKPGWALLHVMCLSRTVYQKQPETSLT